MNVSTKFDIDHFQRFVQKYVETKKCDGQADRRMNKPIPNPIAPHQLRWRGTKKYLFTRAACLHRKPNWHCACQEP